MRKSLDDLKRMTREELVSHLLEDGYTREELLVLMEQAKFVLKRTYETPELVEKVARELSQLGVFQRIANGRSK